MTPRQFIDRYPSLLAKHGSQRAVARKLNIPRTTIQDWLRAEHRIRFTQQAPQASIVIATPKRGVKRFIFTSAQDNTEVHLPFLLNLEAYAEHLGARLIVGGFTYNKKLFEDNRVELSEFDPAVAPYMHNRRLEIGPNLMWLGEMNTLPTATMPLAGFETYTQSKWGVFPHAKVQLVSVATMKGTPAKQLMTTGAVTMQNYVQRRAGIKAHFHHVFGAVLVEIDSDGDHFCRHLLGDKVDGSFQDLTKFVSGGVIHDGHSVEAINWGDIHTESLDKVVANASFNLNGITKGSMLDVLRPSMQLIHDVSDFKYRNHHNIKDAHFRLKMFVNRTESVEDGLQEVGSFLVQSQRPWSESVVVESNHDLALLRWLKESDWKNDPANAEFYLEAQLACVRAIQANVRDFSILEWSLRRLFDLRGIRFLREDELFKFHDIEFGQHGHLGANGSKGSPRQFTKQGSKANTGHSHSPQIIDGVYVAGTCSKLDMGYNKGPSSWAHAHILTYPTGKRTIITLQNGEVARGLTRLRW